MIPDKLPYTKGEKTAEIVCGAVCGVILITELVLLILGKITSGAEGAVLVAAYSRGCYVRSGAALTATSVNNANKAN